MDDEDLPADDATEDELWEMLERATGVDRARILHELGGRAFSDREYEQSVALAESAAVQAREAGDELLTARSLFGQAAGLRRLNRTMELIDVALEAADLLRANGEPTEIAECHGIVATAYSDLGDDTTALEHWSSAARLFESEEQPNEAGRMYMSLGEALGRLGRHAEALETFDRARELFRGTDEPGAVPWADDRAAAALIDLGRVDEALERLRAALSVREAQRDVPRVAYAHYRLGWTLRLVGQFEDALSHLSVAAELFDELDDLEGRARCDLEAANALTSLGQYEEAEELYRRTRAVFDALGHDSQVVLSDANRAVLLARTDQLQEAADLNRALIDRAQAAQITWLLGDISNHLARNLIDLDRPDEALSVLEQQDEAWLEKPASVQAAALRARALLATGRRAMATRAAEEGLGLAAEDQLVAERAELYEIRGKSRLPARNGPRVAAAERDLAHAVALYLAAGLTERARELSTRFLPRPGVGVHRGGGFLTEQPTLPLAEPKQERGEPRQAPGATEPRNE
jgi:tetratricopeptide (TPR) repeat protein